MSRHETGVTLLELLVVVALLGTLAAIVPLAITGRDGQEVTESPADSASRAAAETGAGQTICTLTPPWECERWLPDGEHVGDQGQLLLPSP